MALTVRQLAERLASHLQGALPGWHHSVYPVELMPYDTRPTQHQAWAVAVTATVPAALDRQRRSEGAHVVSSVSVAWAYRVRDDGAAMDVPSAYDAEAELLAALLGVEPDPDLSVQFARATRRTTAGEVGMLLLGVLELTVYHRLPLT